MFVWYYSCVYVQVCLYVFLFLVVSKLHSHALADTAEGGRLNLPVVDGISEQTYSIVENALHSESHWTEIIHPDRCDVIIVQVNYL